MHSVNFSAHSEKNKKTVPRYHYFKMLTRTLMNSLFDVKILCLRNVSIGSYERQTSSKSR